MRMYSRASAMRAQCKPIGEIMSASDDVGERIKAVVDPAKKALALTWAEVAHRSGVSESTIHRWRKDGGSDDRNARKMNRVEQALHLQQGSIEAAANGDLLPDAADTGRFDRYYKLSPARQRLVDPIIDAAIDMALNGGSTLAEQHQDRLNIDEDTGEVTRSGRQLALTA